MWPWTNHLVSLWLGYYCKITVICLIHTCRLRSSLARQHVGMSTRHAEADLSLLCSCPELAACKQDQSWKPQSNIQTGLYQNYYTSQRPTCDGDKGAHLCHVCQHSLMLVEPLPFLFLCTMSQVLLAPYTIIGYRAKTKKSYIALKAGREVQGCWIFVSAFCRT